MSEQNFHHQLATLEQRIGRIERRLGLQPMNLPGGESLAVAGTGPTGVGRLSLRTR